jgi:lambda repressor-like predicted transcriptional regulator
MLAMPKRNYDPAMVRALLAERERNSWSLGELSRRSGVPVGTLSSWAAKAMRSRQADADAQFAEVVLAPTSCDGDAMVRLQHGSGWAIELHGAAAMALVAKLAEVVTRCC